MEYSAHLVIVMSLLLLIDLMVIMAESANLNNSVQSDSPKTYFNGFFRRFAFPPGTFIIFEPEITIPAWRPNKNFREGRTLGNFMACKEDFLDARSPREEDIEEEEYVAAIENSAIQISSPFYVYFDRLGWTHEDSIYNSAPQVAKFIQEFFVKPTRDLFGVPPAEKAKSTSPILNKETHKMPLSDFHRLKVFHKLEKLLEEMGAENGKACLLRTICEIHELPFDSGRFGLFGEVLALILGTIPFEDQRKRAGAMEGNRCLSIYAQAERLGKAKDCSRYIIHCQFSIFKWYWTIPNKST